ncbi:MAG: hypothetical protein J7L08_03920 [Candidatus Aenigmarchaeota archaeon]|nr:hypothetical protein [Candidatus Aenigmarchaeota archaeon]
MKHSIKWGLFIGVTVASVSSLILRVVRVNYWTLVGILYLYSVVGFTTSYIVYKDLRKRMKTKIEKKLDEILERI